MRGAKLIPPKTKNKHGPLSPTHSHINCTHTYYIHGHRAQTPTHMLRHLIMHSSHSLQYMMPLDIPVSEEGRDLLRRLLVVNPEQRATLEQVNILGILQGDSWKFRGFWGCSWRCVWEGVVYW